jgi:ABC-type multidrug transport system ATPase subunit
MGDGAAIEVRSITKSFHLSAKQRKNNRTNERLLVAVNNLSFEVRRGQIYGLLGPNGAGKTTTLRMLATLISPDSGDALINGHSIVTDSEQVRRTIGFLTSELHLEEVFTPDYLFDFFSSLHQIDRETRDRRKKELFSRFGIDRYAQTKVADLSTGMKQKASLVMAIVHDPDVIIFDEPTNGLDIVASRLVVDFLLEMKHQGKTILLSTHMLDLVEKICDEVGIILNGRMAAQGTCEQLSAGGSLEDAFFRIYQEQGGEVR